MIQAGVAIRGAVGRPNSRRQPRDPLITSIPKVLRRYWGICGVALLVR